jgi:hypothetical protein
MKNEMTAADIKILNEQKLAALKRSNWGDGQTASIYKTVEDAEKAGWTYVRTYWVPPDAANPRLFGLGIRGVYDE